MCEGVNDGAEGPDVGFAGECGDLRWHPLKGSYVTRPRLELCGAKIAENEGRIFCRLSREAQEYIRGLEVSVDNGLPLGGERLCPA